MLGKIIASFCLFLTICGTLCLLLDGFFEKHFNISDVCFTHQTNSGVLSKTSKNWYDDEDDLDDEQDPILNNY